MGASRKFQLVLLLLTLASALIMGYLVVWLASGGRSAELARRRAVLGVEADIMTETALAPTVGASPTTRVPGPTPTFVPVTPSNTATPTLPIVAELPSPDPALDQPPTDIPPTDIPPTDIPPTDIPPSIPVAVPPSPTAQPAPPPPPPVVPDPIVVNGPAVRLEDTAWQGGFRQGRGYGGRSATWIYGTATNYTSMQSVIVLDTPPSGTATLSIEGMDSEDRVKTPIRITINGREIFNGPNPLPNDDLPLATGTWATHAFPFDAAVLQPGRNVIRISNLAAGNFGLPPFFMLDYAVLSLPVAAREPPPATATPAPPTDTPPPTELPTDTPPPTDPSLPPPTSEPPTPTPEPVNP